MKKIFFATPLICLLLISEISFAQQVGHITEINSEFYSEVDSKNLNYRTDRFSYKNGQIVKHETVATKLSDRYSIYDKKLRYSTVFSYNGIFKSLAVYSLLDEKADSMAFSTREILYYGTDSLLTGMQEQTYSKTGKTFYSYNKTIYTFLKNHSFKGYEVFQVKEKNWSEFYQCFYDSTETKKYQMLFQSHKTGKYETTAQIYFDSIRIVKDKLQFLLRSDETASDDKMYDKYVFTTKGAFVSYENWGYYSDVKKYIWNSSWIFKSDANGRPLEAKEWVEEEETGDGPSQKHVVNDIRKFSYEPSGKLPIVTKKTGSFTFVDWCLDIGKPIEMILLDQNLKVQHYSYFPVGQPYFKTDSVPPGSYYLILFSREESSGGMLPITL